MYRFINTGASPIFSSIKSFAAAPKQLALEPEMLGGVRHAGGLKELKRRMKSVNSIKKITKTMKMIASSRLKAAQNRAEDSRGFSGSLTKLISSLPPSDAQGKKELVILISTDRGLCGGINSSIVKVARALVRDNTAKGITTEFAIIGDKGATQLQRGNANNLVVTTQQIAKQKIQFLSIEKIIDKVLSEEYVNATILYNKFVSAISFVPSTLKFNTWSSLLKRLSEQNLKEFDLYEFEDDQNRLHLRDLYEYHLAGAVYSGILENQASELGARMSSMDSANRNASEMLKKLSITYNRGRQAAITTELIEIISGAQALAG